MKWRICICLLMGFYLLAGNNASQAQDKSGKLEVLVARIDVATTDRDAWQERAAWSRRMHDLGYVSKAQADSDQSKLESAEYGLKKLLSERDVLSAEGSKESKLGKKEAEKGSPKVGEPGKDKGAKVKELQQERLATLQLLVKKELQRAVEGNSNGNEALGAIEMLAEAELQICASDKERVIALEKLVVILREAEDMLTEFKGVKRGSLESAALKAKAERLRFEIALESAKSKAAGKAGADATVPELQPGKEKTQFKGIDAATVAAYEKLGAQYGAWVTKRFPTGYQLVEFEPGSKHAENLLPVFLMKSLPENLPQVAVPFGLDLSRCDVTDSKLMGLTGLTNLTALKLRSIRVNLGKTTKSISITDAGLAQLAALKNLTSLDLERTDITGPGLKELEGLDKLTSLNLAHTNVTDWGLKGLAGFKNLTTLDVSGTKVTGEGLKYLAGCKHLTSLSVDGSIVTDGVFLQLRDLGLLHALDIAKGKDGARPKSAADIVSLDISRTQITAEGLKALAGMKSLRVLVLHYKNLSNEVFNKSRPVGAAELKVLRELGLLHILPMATGKDGSRPKSAEEITSFDLPVGDAGLKELAGLTNLRSLKLDGSVTTGFIRSSNTRPTDEEVQAYLNKLKERSVTDAGLKELAPFKNLATLTIHSDFVTDAGLKQLAPLKSLTTLDLRGCSITDAGLKELAALPNLATLELGGRQRNMGGGTKFSGRDITDGGLKQLSELKKLTSLFLTDTSVTNTGIAQMRTELPTCQIFIQKK